MKTENVAEFGAEDFDAADEAEMTVRINGKPTSWVWSFAGPGHPQTIAQGNRLARERLNEEREKEEARVNGRKWVDREDTPEEARLRNVNWVVERIVGWSPVKIEGELVPFSQDAARKILMDPRKGQIFVQALEFLASEKSFMRRSAGN
jgi:hypothetical protein